MMTLFSISANNIKKNFKNYWAYFLSSSFSVFIIYLFMSILYSKNIQQQLGDMKKFITLFYVGAVMIIFFSAFFMWYSNSFFIKCRKKEFATYMFLGMSKNQLARLNFLENIIIMLLSLITGIILGLIFTKFFIMLLFFIIKTPASVPFQFNIKALKISLIVFLIIFLIITLHGSILIRRSELIDLFNASKKVEKALKVSFLTSIFAVLSIVFIAYGYYIAVKQLGNNITKFPLVVALIVIGTILFFTCTTSMIIYINKRNEKNLFSGTKIISTAQLYYRYRGNVGTLSIIAISTTIALCALVTCIGSYSRAEENSRYMRPLSVEYFNVNDANENFQKVLRNHSEISVKSKDNIELLKLNLTDPLAKVEENFYIISQSKFNKINHDENIDRKVNLKNDDDCYFIQIQSFATNEKALNKKIAVKIGKVNYKLNVAGTDIKPFIALDHFSETLVVKDAVYNDIKQNTDKTNIVNITGYILKNDFKAEKFVSDLQKNMTKESNVLTFYEHYKDGLKLLGMMAFIGLFIGLLFITATGSIIYFKLTMDAREDKSKFITLSKIGVSRDEIRTAVSKELLILFGAPFLVAAINTYPATIALGKMLALKLMNIYIIILIIYAAIYCIYYFATLKTYMKIVRE